MQRNRAVEPARQQQVDDDAEGLAPLHILVAEDNPVNQEVALGMLESLGCDVTVVDHGADALEAYQTAVPGRFDVILMDCQMPVMDGFEATKCIRAWERGKRHIPILALTANTNDGVGAACLEAGMDDMLSKPFRRQALQALLDRWRSKGEAAEHLEPQPQPASPASVLEQGVLQSLRDLDPDGSKGLLQRTIVKFTHYGDDLVANMMRSAIDRDMPEVSRLAHSLKSSSANLGAVDLAGRCQEIESSTRDITAPIDLSRQLEGLATSYQTAKQALLSLASA